MGYYRQNESVASFRFQPIYQVITRKPSTSIISAMSKIGGLLALLRFSVLLRFYHETLFHCKINKKLGYGAKSEGGNQLLESGEGEEDVGVGPKDVKEVMTFENFAEMMETIKR